MLITANADDREGRCGSISKYICEPRLRNASKVTKRPAVIVRIICGRQEPVLNTTSYDNGETCGSLENCIIASRTKWSVPVHSGTLVSVITEELDQFLAHGAHRIGMLLLYCMIGEGWPNHTVSNFRTSYSVHAIRRIWRFAVSPCCMQVPGFAPRFADWRISNVRSKVASGSIKADYGWQSPMDLHYWYCRCCLPAG